MSDLISRQAAIDALTKNMPSWTTPDGSGQFDHDIQVTDEAYVDCVQIVHDLPSAQRWIHVSEGLPKANGRYFVTRGLNACGALWNRVYIINYSDLMGLKSEKIWWNGNVGKSDFEEITDVVAWMPSPEPWKGEENV